MCAVKSLILLSILAVALPDFGVAAEELPVTRLVIQAEIPRGAGAFMGFGFGSLWTVSRTRQLVRVNPADNSVIDIEINSYGSHRAPGIGEGAVWVPATGRGLILKVDPIANKLIQTIEAKMLDPEGSIGVGEGGVWVLTAAEAGDTADRNLTRYNPMSGAIDAIIPLPSYSAGVVVDFGSVWVTGHGRGELYRIDPQSNAIVSTLKLHEGPRFIASGEGSIWVLNHSDGTVQRIDGKTGELIATIETGLSFPNLRGGDIVCGGGYVWVSAQQTPVTQINPKTNTVVRKFTGGHMSDAIRYGAGSLWVSGPVIYRIEPPQ